MLTDKGVAAIKATGKLKKIADGQGLTLMLSPTGAKSWALRYRVNGKEQTMGLGSYPAVSLKEAREAAFLARQKHQQGINPVMARRMEKLEKIESQTNTLRGLFKGLVDSKRIEGVSEKYLKGVEQAMDKHVFPHIGDVPVADIKPAHMLVVLKQIASGNGKNKAAPAVAKKCAFLLSEAFDLAVVLDLVSWNPAQRLPKAVPTHKKKPNASITSLKKLPQLLRDLDDPDNYVMQRWFRLQSYLYVRPSMLSHAAWEEFDLEDGLWRIPGSRMKMQAEFVIPLPQQALQILHELRAYSGRSRWVFPQLRGSRTGREERPMDRTMPQRYLVKKGYSGKQTAHGFRHIASTIMREAGYPRDIVEFSLAHAPKSEVERAYMHAKFIYPRRMMGQAWADFIDAVREGGDYLPVLTERQPTVKRLILEAS